MKGVMQLGTTIVVVQDENFSVHYQQGYQRFQREYKGRRLISLDVFYYLRILIAFYPALPRNGKDCVL
jgi:hypothetical protein